MPDIFNAIALAARAHGTRLYGSRPYIHHLAEVVDNLYDYGYTDENLICAGWLHDVVEDTDYTIENVNYVFGPEVAQLVQAVTAPYGATRDHQQQATVSKLIAHPQAIPLKMADRLANIRSCAKENKVVLFEMYRAEMRYYDVLFTAQNPVMAHAIRSYFKTG